MTTIRTASGGDADALIRLWAEVFTPALEPDQWLIDDDRFAHTLVAVDELGVCGSIYGLPKQLRESDGGVALAHCIGSVAVPERSRGQGLARQLVTASLDTAGDADWALLFTGTPGVYRSSGFESFEMPRTLSGAWHGFSAGSEAITRSSVEGLGRLQHVYEASRADLVLAPVRSGRDWAMAEVRLAGARLYAHGEQGYAIAEVRGKTGVLAEIAVLPAASAAVRHELLSAIASDWAAAGVTACDLAVPQMSAEEAALSDFAPDAARRTDRTGMTRPLRRAPRLAGIRHFTAGDYF